MPRCVTGQVSLIGPGFLVWKWVTEVAAPPGREKGTMTHEQTPRTAQWVTTYLGRCGDTPAPSDTLLRAGHDQNGSQFPEALEG